mmetsp:Transcript_32525/g.93473  ORF Transcript_32525/g.93473 Transcript_32525/m.93473 type:complete len:376 (-) Transcript_32525:18-1145(-)
MLRAATIVAVSIVVSAWHCSSATTCGRVVDDSASLLQLQVGAAASCPASHLADDRPEALDVAWATDGHQVEGLKASVASAIDATHVPLRAHIMVLRSATSRFQELFGIRKDCLSVEAAGGRAVVILHPFDAELVKKSIPVLLPDLLDERGGLDAPEQAVRLYMHHLFDSKVVIWLDCDTIVRRDLSPLRSKLLESGRTIGFADRWMRMSLKKMMNISNPCNFEPDLWERLLNFSNYNSGVYVVNLERWARLRITERIEGLVAKHNACGGKLWAAADQVPLLLSFYLPALQGEPEDFSVFGPIWNGYGLGCRAEVEPERIALANVMHWTGPHKPWLANGWHRQLWLPHLDRFSALFPRAEAQASTTRPPTAAMPPG